MTVIDSPHRRTAVTWVLALVWLLDAALQYQPYMFTTDFPNDVIAGAGQGSPTWVRAPDAWSAHLMAHHIVVWNGLFATVQLAIALGLVWRRTVRLALAGSIVWSVLVWWLGEGLGQVLAGPSSPLMGFPGAVIIYALIALLVWPRDDEPGAVTRIAAQAAWVVLWVAAAFEALRPADRAPGALHDMITGMAEGEPSWVATLNRWGGDVVGQRGTEISIVLAVVFVLAAVSVFLPPSYRRPVLLVVGAVSALIWVFAQDFGEIPTGQATDPNSGPLLVLLVACYWPGRSRRDESATPVRDATVARV